MTSPNLRTDIYDPKTLVAMDQAFAAVWRMLMADDPFRGFASGSELRIAISTNLLKLIADGVTDPLRLRNLTVESLLCEARCFGAASSQAINNLEARAGAVLSDFSSSRFLANPALKGV